MSVAATHAGAPVLDSISSHIAVAINLVTQTDNSEGPIAPKGPNAPPNNSPSGSNVLPTGNPSSPSTPTTKNHATSPTAGAAADFAPQTVEPFGTGPSALQLITPVGDNAPGSATGFAPQTIAPLGDSPNALQPTAPIDADTPGNATTGFVLPTITTFGTGPNALQPTAPIGADAPGFFPSIVGTLGAPLPTSDPTLPASGPIRAHNVLLAENRKANKMRPTNSNTARCKAQFYPKKNYELILVPTGTFVPRTGVPAMWVALQLSSKNILIIFLRSRLQYVISKYHKTFI